MKAFLSKLGQSFMLPIALLPAAGIMLGIGGSFTSDAFIEGYHLSGLLGKGTVLNGILTVLNDAGSVVFSNLPILFAIALVIAFANKDKGTAALATTISYLVMNTVIASIIKIGGMAVEQKDGTFLFNFFGNKFPGMLTDMLGISNTLSMGVFGGIIVGGITAMLHNRYNGKRLPDFLGFFGGQRFVPIVASFAALIYGALLIVVWPPIGYALSSIGGAMIALSQMGLGWIASGIHGVIERSLIPMGLHHVYYMPLWQTSVGGSADFMINGHKEVIYGTQNIFMMAVKTGDWSKVTATNFMTGKFPFMMFGLPGAAYAMYTVADKENKKQAGGLLFSVGLTAFLTGITEPIEFTFLFLAPVLFYGFHVWMAGLSFALMDALNVKIGQTFSGGFIDYVLYGILPGVSGANNNYYFVPIVGIGYFLVYFLVFRWFIVKNDIKTPGRGAAVKMMSKKDYKETKGEDAASNGKKDKAAVDTEELEMAKKIVDALGGKDNLDSVDACITRLRVGVKDESKVADQAKFTGDLGAMGLSKNGKAIQVIYGAQAAKYKDIINEEIL